MCRLAQPQPPAHLQNPGESKQQSPSQQACRFSDSVTTPVARQLQTFGIPPPPQTASSQVPQFRVPPHPSGMESQFFPSASQVVGVQPQTPGLLPPPQVC